MKTYIISFGGLTPAYHSENDNLTCHPSEAQKFASIEQATAFIKENYPSYTHPASIKTSDTLQWIKTPNW